MTWKDTEIAYSMGYEHCVLFDCARDAMRAYLEVKDSRAFLVPENICPSLADMVQPAKIDQKTGLSEYAVHLYGYQAANQSGDPIALDPLMTGWVRHLKTKSAIISFGHKKMLSIGYGGAFLTNDKALAQEMEVRGYWNQSYSDHLLGAINGFYEHIQRRWEAVQLWDRYLGDSLIRIPGEQLMPWRVMRRARDAFQRYNIVYELRKEGIEVGTNYPPLTGSNQWGDTVLNFFCSANKEWWIEIRRACQIVKRTVNNG